MRFSYADIRNSSDGDTVGGDGANEGEIFDCELADEGGSELGVTDMKAIIPIINWKVNKNKRANMKQQRSIELCS